jgi:general secretion pathway protein D
VRRDGAFSILRTAAPSREQVFNREQSMKMTGILLACGLAALSVTGSAQESSKMSSGAGGIELQELISKYAKRNHKQIVIDPRVRAEVPLAGIDAADLTYDQLLAVLNVHMFSVVNSGGVMAVVPDANARQLPSATYTDLDFKAPDYEIVTVLVTPKKVCAAMLVPVLRPLMPQAAHLAAEVQTNTLIINDRAVNARRIGTMIGQLDKLGTANIKDCQQGWGAGPMPGAKPMVTEKVTVCGGV